MNFIGRLSSKFKNHFGLYNCAFQRNYCEPAKPTEKKGLVLGCHSDNGQLSLTPAAAKYNETSGGKLLELIKETKPQLARGEKVSFNNIDDQYWTICVVGLGMKCMGYNPVEMVDEDKEAVRAGCALGAATCAKTNKCQSIYIDCCDQPEAAAEGAGLAVWEYRELSTVNRLNPLPTLHVYDKPKDIELWQLGLFKAESQNFVRTICSTPSNIMTPMRLAQLVVDELCPCDIQVKVHDKDWIEDQKMDCFLSVAKGSCQQPVFMEIIYCGAPPSEKPILLVGKGFTYDSGGLCTRKCKEILQRTDLTGAAIMISIIRACASMNLPINLRACLPICEHLPSGMAMRVGDILHALDEQNILVEDTDNAGRVTLVDALVYGQKVHKPRLILDVTTQTSGVVAALGSSASGVFSNSHSMWKQVKKASSITGDRVWRMPLWKWYTERVTSNTSVDVINRGRGKGSSCLGAAFLKEFISCVDWVHFDIEGVGMTCIDNVYPYYAKGLITGRPIRTLIQLIYQLACSPADTTCKPSTDK